MYKIITGCLESQQDVKIFGQLIQSDIDDQVFKLGIKQYLLLGPVQTTYVYDKSIFTTFVYYTATIQDV